MAKTDGLTGAFLHDEPRPSQQGDIRSDHGRSLRSGNRDAAP